MKNVIKRLSKPRGVSRTGFTRYFLRIGQVVRSKKWGGKRHDR